MEPWGGVCGGGAGFGFGGVLWRFLRGSELVFEFGGGGALDKFGEVGGGRGKVGEGFGGFGGFGVLGGRAVGMFPAPWKK